MGDAGSDHSQSISDHVIDFEDDLDSDLRVMENFVEGVPSSGDENFMGVNGPLGLEPEPIEQGDDAMQHEEDIDSSNSTVHESYQDSLESRISTSNNNDIRSPNIEPQLDRASDLLMAVSVSADANKVKIIGLASAAMEELRKMALKEEPLWRQRVDQFNQPTETLDGLEYMKEFGSVEATWEEYFTRMVDPMNVGSGIPHMMPQELLQEHHFRREASRTTGLVNADGVGNIVELLMDVDQWSEAFSNMVSRVELLGVLSTGVEGSYDGTLLVLKAEFHLPTVLVPARESYFARFCKQLSLRTWGVVDVSLEDLFYHPSVNYRRRPSGCLIQQTNDNHLEVTWVEHATVRGLVHNIYRPLVVSGFAFGSRRWLTSLVKHFDWLATLIRAATTPTHGLITQAGRVSLLRLSENMRRSFWSDINTANGKMWTPLPILGAEDMKIMLKGNISVAEGPPATKIFFTTSIWLPVPHKSIFNFLTDGFSRHQWDIHLRNKMVRELAYIKNGGSPENRVSILQVNTSPDKIEMSYLQECFTDQTGSYVIYAPVDLPTLSRVLNGGCPDRIHVLPGGFVILPDSPVSGGSLLTMAFLIIDKASIEECIPGNSMKTVCWVMKETSNIIRSVFLPNNLPDN